MKALVLAVLALSGCYLKAKDTVVESPISAARSTTAVVAEKPTEVVATTRANVLSVRVVTPRQCATQTMQDFEVVHKKKVTVDVSLWLIPAVVIPQLYIVVAPVSALIAAVQAGSDPDTYQENRVLERRTFSCAVPLADQVAQIRFPSGATFEARTDKRGIATLFIPDDEVDHGAARIELATVARTINYDRRSYDAEQLAIVVDE